MFIAQVTLRYYNINLHNKKHKQLATMSKSNRQRSSIRAQLAQLRLQVKDLEEERLALHRHSDQSQIVESHIADLVERLPIAICMINKIGHIKYCSEQFTANHNVSSLHFHDLASSDTWKQERRTSRLEEQSILNGSIPRVIREEKRVDDPNNSSRWFRIAKEPWLQKDNTIVGIIITEFDITSEKQKHESLLTEKQVLDTILDFAPNQIYLKDVQGAFIKTNSVLAKELGVESRDMTVGKTDFNFHNNWRATRARTEERSIIQSRVGVYNLELSHVKKDGNWECLLVNKSPVFDSQGNVKGIVGINCDITDSKIEFIRLERRVKYLETISKLTLNIPQYENFPIKSSYVEIVHNLLSTTVQDFEFDAGTLFTFDSESRAPQLLAHNGIETSTVSRSWIVEKIREYISVENLDKNNHRLILVPDSTDSSRLQGELLIYTIPRTDTGAGVGFAFYYASARRIPIAGSDIAFLYLVLSFCMSIVNPVLTSRILETTLRMTQVATGGDWVSIAIFKDGGIRKIAQHPYVTDYDENYIRKTGQTSEIMRNGIPIFIEDTTVEKFINPHTKEKGYESVAGVPIKDSRGGRIGVMWIHYLKKHTFSAEEKKYIELIANQAGLALLIADLSQQQQQQSLALRILYETAQDINVKSNLKKILDNIAKFATLMVRKADQDEHCTAYVALIRNNNLQFISSFPRKTVLNSLFEKGIHRINLAEINEHRTIVVRSLLSKNLENVSNVENDKDYVAIDPNVKSQLAVPFFDSNGNPLGVIGIESNYYSAFDSTDMGNVAALANQAAVAVQKSLSNEKSKERLKQLETLKRTTDEISKSHTFEDLLQKIVDNAVALLAAKGGALLIYQERQASLVVAASSGRNSLDLNLRLRVGEGLAGTLIEEKRRHIWNPDYATWDEKSSSFDDIPLHAIVAVTLELNKQVIGVIVVDDKKGRVFTDDEISILTMFADQASIAFQNSQKLQDITRAWETVQQIPNLAAFTSDQKALEHVADATKKAFNCDVVTLYAYDEDTKTLLYNSPIVVGANYPGRMIIQPVVPENSLVWTMTEKNSPYPVPDVTTHDLFKDKNFVRNEGIKSCIATPLFAFGKKVGIMFLNYRSPQNFVGDELFINLELFANQAGIAIANSRYVAAERVQTMRLETLKDHLEESNTLILIGLLIGELLHHTGNNLGWVLDTVDNIARGKLDQNLELLHTQARTASAKIVEFNDFINGRRNELLRARFSQISIHSLIETVLSKKTNIIDAIRPVFEYHAQDDLVSGPENQISQVLFVVFDNAIRSMIKRRGGILTISTVNVAETSGKYLVVSITDTGNGIPFEKIRDIFKLKPKIDLQKKGMGIGLPWSIAFLRYYGGDIKVKSVLGSRTTFELYLPLVFENFVSRINKQDIHLS